MEQETNATTPKISIQWKAVKKKVEKVSHETQNEETLRDGISEPQQKVIKKTADMVSKNGTDFENLLKERIDEEPTLKFLVETSSNEFKYYQFLLENSRKNSNPFQEEKNVEINEQKNVNEKPSNFNNQESTIPDSRKRKSRWGDMGSQGPSNTNTSNPVTNVNHQPTLHPTPVHIPIHNPIQISIPNPVQTPVYNPIHSNSNSNSNSIPPENQNFLAYLSQLSKTNQINQPSQLTQYNSPTIRNPIVNQSGVSDTYQPGMIRVGNKWMYPDLENIDGGSHEHRKRLKEMSDTYEKSTQLTRAAEERNAHHISDYLPPEELEKFLKKKEKKDVVNDEAKVDQSNVGFQLLQKIGWSGGGLGLNENGITNPIQAVSRSEGVGLGLVEQEHEPNEDDDEFGTYRKRMMLAYKYRPNPLNNPRRAYY